MISCLYNISFQLKKEMNKDHIQQEYFCHENLLTIFQLLILAILFFKYIKNLIE